MSKAFVSLARSTPLEHHGREPGILPGATRERGILRRQVHQVVEISTREAHRTLLALQGNPGMTAKLFSTFAALGFMMCNEDLYVFHSIDTGHLSARVESHAAWGMATHRTGAGNSSTPGWGFNRFA